MEASIPAAACPGSAWRRPSMCYGCAMVLLLALHVLSAVAWVGGMFFAYLVLRPAAGPLEPPLRLALWRRVFDRFFPWVWAAVALLLLSGYGMVFVGFGGFRGAGLHVHVMQATGILMML